MNRTQLRALAASMALGAAALATAQGWPAACDDPSTTNSIWTNYNSVGAGTPLFGAGVSTRGTVLYETCPPNFTSQAQGGIQFFIPGIGSVQTGDDDDVALTAGSGFFWFGQELAPLGGRGNWGYAGITRQDGAATTPTPPTRIVNVSSFFVGASDRYFIIDGAQGNTAYELRVDAVGDAARFQWTLTNNGPATRLGFWVGQSLDPIKNFFPFEQKPIEFINIPGQKPLQVMRRFTRNPNPAADIPEHRLPQHIDFMRTQANAWTGMRIINDASPSVDGPFPDQTNVDSVDIGTWLLLPSLMGGAYWGDNDSFPGQIWPDIAIGTLPIFVQKWEGRPAAAQDAPLSQRQVRIVAYYKTTWGDSDFSRPYNVTVDTPKVIGVQDQNPFQFVRSPGTVRVYIDNTRGFSTVEKEIPLVDVKVTLNLPQGMYDATDASRTRRQIVRRISRIDPKQMSFTDFAVAAHETTFGILQYSVVIEPQPGPIKTITGQITVATQPYLKIGQDANLVGTPWVYQSSSWAAVLGSPDFRPDIEYQAFKWDPVTQQYVLQTSPERGVGTWIISTKDIPAPKRLGGNPTVPQDLAAGAPLQRLERGWNLISNPYPYPIQLGQIVGVPAGARDSYSYQELVDQNVISSSLAYWDRDTQTYRFIGSPLDYLEPNRGYWVNVISAGHVTISMPPVFIPYVPEGTGGIRSASDELWSFNMVATNGRTQDTTITLAQGRTAAYAAKANLPEPPMAPMGGALMGAWKQGGAQPKLLAKRVFAPGEAANETLFVHTKAGGTVTLRWPDVRQMPSKYRVMLTDKVTGEKLDLRARSVYSYAAGANTSREFLVQVVVADQPLLKDVVVRSTGRALNAPVDITYTVGAPVKTTVRILQGGRLVKTVLNEGGDSEGKHSVLWNLTDGSGRRVRRGLYQAEVRVSDGVQVQTKLTSFTIR